MKLRAFGWLAASLLLPACGRLASGTALESKPATAAAAPAPAAVVGPGFRLRGNAVLGKDGFGIVPCGDSAQQILEVAPDAKPFLDKFLESGAHEFFVEAAGERVPGGHVRALHFERLYSEGPGCEDDLTGIAFAARGTEPFWSISDAREGLRLERPGEPALLASRSTSREEFGEWYAEGDTPEGKLTLRLTPAWCSDGMSDALYAWKATVRLGDKAFHGCGFRGFGKN